MPRRPVRGEVLFPLSVPAIMATVDIMTIPERQWPQVTPEAPFRPSDVVYERPDGQFRVLARDGAPGWHLLARDDRMASGWRLVPFCENLPTVREAQDQAPQYEAVVRAVDDAPPLSPETREKLRALLDLSGERPY